MNNEEFKWDMKWDMKEMEYRVKLTKKDGS